MRSILASIFLVALFASSANAAKVHHAQARHVVERPVQNIDPLHPPVLMDQTPRYDDPSRLGGG
jgi:hypothetical protein